MSDAAEQPERDKLIGQVLANRYQIETRLGEGAMGSVYRARHVKVGRAFAVKILHPRLLADSKVAQRFEREAELAGRLRHANVIGAVDVGETTEGLHYMVMDFANGDDLATVLAEAPMKPERIIHLVRQLLEGLYHAHEQGLIHRDFKPENVIVETDMYGAEVPRIVDFGIAILRDAGTATDGEGRLTTNGLVLGTPHYMAPEQAVADPLDHRVDLFALGIVIYEMLCGKLPFDGSGAEVARANLLIDPPPIAKRVLYLEVDPLLEAFSRLLMSKQREHRPATAKAARELLDLIDRDRLAAAAALGVPIQASTRGPAITLPQTPQARHADQGNDTFPPPFASTLAAAELPVQTRVPASERDVNTALTHPIGFTPPEDALPRSSSRRWVLGGVGLVLAGGIAAFALRGGGDQPSDTKVVMQTTPAPVPVADPVPPTTVAPQPQRPEIKDPPPEITTLPPVAKVVRIKDPSTTKVGHVTQPEIKQPEVKQPEVKQPDIAEPQVSQPAIKRPEVKQPEVTVTQSDAAAIGLRYREVGQKLGALGPAANELWPRYRLIRIQDVMTKPDKRAEAAQILSKLERDIAALGN